MKFTNIYLVSMILILAIISIVLVSIPTNLDAQTKRDNQQTELLRIMTFNIETDFELDNLWPIRLPLIQELITHEQPDVIGTQEGDYNQLQDLSMFLHDYDWIGLGREGGKKDEFMAIFYNKHRLNIQESGNYWLSETPDIPGSVS